MIEFLYGIIFGSIAMMGIATLDVVIFKDKFINLKVGNYKQYLYFTATEIGCFTLGYLVGVK